MKSINVEQVVLQENTINTFSSRPKYPDFRFQCPGCGSLEVLVAWENDSITNEKEIIKISADFASRLKLCVQGKSLMVWIWREVSWQHTHLYFSGNHQLSFHKIILLFKFVSARSAVFAVKRIRPLSRHNDVTTVSPG